MQAVAVDLDHIGTVVADLDRGRQAFERMGFTLTARSHHQGAATPGGPVEPWGSANHCAMLAQGYLEILGIVDDTKFSAARALLARHEGPHIIAFRPASFEAVQALTQAGQPIDPARSLSRLTAFGADGEMRPVAFRNMRFDRSVFPEAQFQFTEHLTRDVMWQPGLVTHPNGAVALERIYLCCNDPLETASRFSPLLGIEPRASSADEWMFDFDASALCILGPRAWRARTGGDPAHALPAPVGFAVRTSSLEMVRDALRRNGVEFGAGPAEEIRVGAAEACGNVIEFVGS
jgi:catechol 2,3-dioxygenase-like lactoylglutathione lyase family enzyme